MGMKRRGVLGKVDTFCRREVLLLMGGNRRQKCSRDNKKTELSLLLECCGANGRGRSPISHRSRKKGEPSTL